MDRVPPHNVDAEKSVLGSVFIKPAVFDEIATLQIDDFFMPPHRLVYEAMVAVMKRRHPLDVIAVADELKNRALLTRLDGGESYLLALANAVPTAENVGHYVRIVKEKATLRRLIATCGDVMSRAYGDFGDFDPFMRETQQAILGVSIDGASDKTETLWDIRARIEAEIEAAERGETPSRVPTGIRRLDKVLGGGMRAEHLIVPAGLTSLGKSSLAFQFAFRGAYTFKIPALIFTLEMTKEELFIKGAASLARVDSMIFQPPEPGHRAPWSAISPAFTMASGLSDLIRVETARDIGKIRAIATSWRRDNPDPRAIVVVDLIQKIRGVRMKGDARHEEVAGVARDLKDLAKDLKCPVVAPSQLDNDAAKEKRAPTIGDLRDSKVIEQEADVILGIHRDRMLEAGEAEVIVLKNRGGRVGKITCQWKGPWQGFEDQVEDEADERRYRD